MEDDSLRCAIEVVNVNHEGIIRIYDFAAGATRESNFLTHTTSMLVTMQEFKSSIKMFSNSGHRFDEITTVEISRVTFFECGCVDMSGDDVAPTTFFTGKFLQATAKLTDDGNRFLDVLLNSSRKRPETQAEYFADSVEGLIENDEEIVENGPRASKPFRDSGVKDIAMDDEEATTIESREYRFINEFDGAEIHVFQEFEFEVV